MQRKFGQKRKIEPNKKERGNWRSKREDKKGWRVNIQMKAMKSLMNKNKYRNNMRKISNKHFRNQVVVWVYLVREALSVIYTGGPTKLNMNKD